ncbi:nucleotidyltransferase domain-containing protein [Paenibacillus piri]|uniref:nucleotidyltransferase domain-containing protein n=1 Tax=Paenibacillus piri TaxID=2547395 RepID=UPI001FE921B6|nr:hypothetical protein [Paenibacillus piri]
MPSTLDHLENALRQVQLRLRGVDKPWLVGGSCGLLLHGVPLQAPPRDLDLYADDESASELHRALSGYAVDEQTEDRSGMYRSILSHYSIEDIKVELVCGFEVTAHESVYRVEAGYLVQSQPIAIRTGGVMEPETESDVSLPPLKLMPLEHELLFNVLRDRPDRYEAIAGVMRSRSKGMTPFMRELMRRNRLGKQVKARLKRLLQP